MIKIRLIAAGADDATEATEIQGRPGQSLMQAAVDANVKGIAADCGGSLICASCHVYVREPHASALPAPVGDELDMLDFTAAPRRENSRLSCQIELTEALDGLVVEVPDRQH